MEYLLVGKYVNTHGIKGEIRIMSDFPYKDKIFIKGFRIYIGNNKKELIINTHRLHKDYNMLTFNDINNINDIEMFKGSNIYINKEDLDLDNNFQLIEDLIDFDVYADNIFIGKIIEVIREKANDVIVVGDKRILIPYVEEFILSIDSSNKRIDIKNIKGLIE